MSNTRLQNTVDISSNVYTNRTQQIKGDTVRDRLLNLNTSCVNLIDDANVANGYMAIDNTSKVDVTFIRAATPVGYFLRDDGTWQIAGAILGSLSANRIPYGVSPNTLGDSYLKQVGNSILIDNGKAITSADGVSFMTMANGGNIYMDTSSGNGYDSTFGLTPTIVYHTLNGYGGFSATTSAAALLHTVQVTLGAPILHITFATINTVPFIDGSHNLAFSTVTPTVLNYITNLTSDAQTQITARELLANKATDFTTVNNTLYPTTQAVNNLVGAAVSGVLDECGPYDPTITSLYPTNGGTGTAGAILKGNLYFISTAGNVNGISVYAGYGIYALVDTPGQTNGNWGVLQVGLGYVPVTNARVINTTGPLTGGGALSADLTIAIPQATGSVDGYLAHADWTSFDSKEPAIGSSTTAKYWRGDKTFQTLDTSVVPENTNLYFTNARAIGATLTGYASGAGTISSSDSTLSAIQKLNGNIAALVCGGDLSGALSAAVVVGIQGKGITLAPGYLKYSGSAWVFDNSTFLTAAVTSVGLSLPGIFTVSGSPVTSTGTLTATLANQTANTVFSGPSSGGAVAPTFRALVAADIPSLSATYLPLSGGTMSGNMNLFADATTGTQPVTYQQFINAINGNNYKANCDYATTGALPANVYNNGSSGVGATLTGVSFGALTIDGSTPSVGQFVLVKNEATQANNGIYVVTTVGGVATLYVLTRRSDFNQASDISGGDATYITRGSTLIGTTWVLTDPGTVTVGTTALTFAQIAGMGTFVAGNGINITGSTISVPNGGISDALLASTFLKTISGIIAGGDLSGTYSTPTVAAIQGKAISLATGYLKYTGSAWSFDNSTFLTANQTITWTPTGDVTGSTTGSTSLTPALSIAANAVTYPKMYNGSQLAVVNSFRNMYNY